MENKIKVFETSCKNCLFTPQRIVSEERAEELIKSCTGKDMFFVCHEASERDYEEHICCRKFFDRYQKDVLPLRLAIMTNNIEFIPLPQEASPVEPNWQIQPQEVSGDYQFAGRCVATKAVKETLSESEIESILQQIRKRVETDSGADYLQVFVHPEMSKKIFVIDNLSAIMLKSDQYSEAQKRENNYFTLMFDEEY